MWFVVLLTALLGSVWRRWLGSANTGPRSLKFIAALPLCWPALALFQNWWAVLAVGLLLLFWAPGHTVDAPSVWLRYGPFALPYWLSRKYWKAEWNSGRFLDGWMPVGEFGIGFMYWGFWALLAGLFL
jgi:hypothetical protein